MADYPRRKASEAYLAKLRDPRWQKKRLQILERDELACQICGDTESTLHVHHRRYINGREPWECPPEILVTLCEDCHEGETEFWPEAIGCLTDMMKELFWSGDVHAFACDLHMSRKAKHPVFLSAISLAARDEKMGDAVIAAYFARRKELNGE